jgi:hypothetical protein
MRGQGSCRQLLCREVQLFLFPNKKRWPLYIDSFKAFLGAVKRVITHEIFLDFFDAQRFELKKRSNRLIDFPWLYDNLKAVADRHLPKIIRRCSYHDIRHSPLCLSDICVQSRILLQVRPSLLILSRP